MNFICQTDGDGSMRIVFRLENKCNGKICSEKSNECGTNKTVSSERKASAFDPLDLSSLVLSDD